MKAIKNIKNKIGILRDYLSNSTSCVGESINNKFRMKARIVLANRWARHHPKRFFVYFLVCMASLVTVNETIYFLVKKNHQNNTATSVLAIRPVFDGIHRIDANREGLKMQLNLLIDEGNTLLNSLDSIYNLPVKTHNDSIEIHRLMKKIETISNILDNETELETD